MLRRLYNELSPVKLCPLSKPERPEVDDDDEDVVVVVVVVVLPSSLVTVFWVV